MGKLKWEYGDKPDEILILKPKGKLSVQEIREFMNEREQILNFGDGALCVIAWRTNTDTYSGWEFGRKPEGDTQEMFVLVDESECFCGRVLHHQYCPECGHELWKR